jgi:hypothetical protein
MPLAGIELPELLVVVFEAVMVTVLDDEAVEEGAGWVFVLPVVVVGGVVVLVLVLSAVAMGDSCKRSTNEINKIAFIINIKIKYSFIYCNLRQIFN